MFKEGGNYAELFQEAHEIEAAHRDRAGSQGKAQKPTLTAAKKYIFSKYGGIGDRVITKKTQMVCPQDEEEDESEIEAVAEATEVPKVGELPEEENAPKGDTQENMEATADDISLTITKALVTSLQQQKGIPNSAAEKRKKAKCYRCSGIGHYAVECPSKEGALNGKLGSPNCRVCPDKPFWQKLMLLSAEKQKPAGGTGGKVTSLPPWINPEALEQWQGPHTVVGMVVNVEPCRALADTGSDITQLTRGYCEQ